MLKNTDKKPATEADVEQGLAAFWIPDQRSNVYDIGVLLPAPAIVAKDIEVGENERIPAGTPVTVIQAEIVDEADIIIGFKYDGGIGVCSLQEITITSPRNNP